MADTSWIGQLNIDQFVKQQMARETAVIQQNMQPKIDQLTQSQTILKTQQNVFQQLQQLIPAFQQSITQLAASFNPTYQVGYSTSGIANVQVVGDASPGTHSLNVTQLAQAQSIESGGTGFTSTSAALSITEEMNISLGPAGSPTGNFSVNISATDSLQSIAANINNSAKANGYGISASIVSTSSGNYQLIISSNQSGTANQFNITETPSGGSQTLNLSTGSGGTGVVLKSAQNAQFTVDGVSYDQASNNNTIQGMNMTLLNTGTTNVNLSTNYQTSGVLTAAQNMVNAYNQIITLAQESQLQSGSIDQNVTLLLSSIQNQMNSTFDGVGTYAGHVLSAIGIQFSATPQAVQVPLANGGGTTTSYITGLLQVDTSTDPADTSSLANILNGGNLSAVQSMLFDSTHGILTKMSKNVLNPGTGSADRAINDPKSGALVSVNSRLATISQQISDTNTSMNGMIRALTAKYALLDVTLQTMQNTSNYIYESTQLMSSGR